MTGLYVLLIFLVALTVATCYWGPKLLDKIEAAERRWNENQKKDFEDLK